MYYPVRISQKDNLFYAEYPDLDCLGIGTSVEKAIQNALNSKPRRLAANQQTAVHYQNHHQRELLSDNN